LNDNLYHQSSLSQRIIDNSETHKLTVWTQVTVSTLYTVKHKIKQ